MYWWVVSVILFVILVAMRMRSMVQRQLSVRHKLLFLSLFVEMASIAVTGWLAIDRSGQAIVEQRTHSLQAIRSARSAQIEEYFSIIRSQISEFSRSTMTGQAVIDFSSSFHSLGNEVDIGTEHGTSAYQALSNYYEQTLKPQVNTEDIDWPGTETLIPDREVAIQLQWMYLSDNPHSDKQELSAHPIDCEYNRLHEVYHPILREYQNSFGYHDIFLFDLEGNLVYSVCKEMDYATNIDDGPFSDTGLANAFRIARDAANPDDVHLEDFAFHLPSYGAKASFVSAPIFYHGEKVGVAAFQMPIGRINSVMQQADGMGETGETYLVGADFLMRTTSRFGGSGQLGKQVVPTEAVKRSLRGESGTVMQLGYRGKLVLTAFAPVYIEGLNWCIVAEIEKSEMLRPAKKLRNSVLWAAIGTAVVVALLAFVSTTMMVHKHYEKELLTSARVDKLTNIPNREVFNRRLTTAFQGYLENRAHKFAVLFLDFDRFKVINDRYGHAIGDALLTEISCRLKSEIDHTDSLELDAEGTTLARLGGDEFVVLLETRAGKPTASEVAESLLRSLNQPYQLQGHEINSTVSIGVVECNRDYHDAEDILRDADYAMYEAKMRGKACYVVFDSTMQQAFQKRIQFEKDVEAAYTNGEFELAYQPIVDLSNGRLSSVEALLRWRHPDYGNVEPSRIIPVAEELGLVVQLSEWVFEAACQQLLEWKMQFGRLAPACVSVNLSKKHFAFGDLVETTKKILGRTRLEPSDLMMEISEAAVMTDFEVSRQVLEDLKTLGVKLALDDFGNGQSTLGMLKDLPIDLVKIDRAFTSEVNDSKHMAALVHAVAVLAHNLGLETVAEGIETDEDLLAVQKVGCGHGQGFYLGNPMSADEFSEFLEQHARSNMTIQGAMAFVNPQHDGLRLLPIDENQDTQTGPIDPPSFV